MKQNGRPEFPDEQYIEWLERMRPFLENANSVYYSMEQAGIAQHKDVIYRKYRLNDWFREKIEYYRTKPGELVNDTIVTLVRTISDKAKRKEKLEPEEAKLLVFYAEKSRSAQPWFVNRTETAQVKPIEEVIEEIDSDADTDQEELSEFAQKQIVAHDASVQDQEQRGQTSNPQAQPNPNETPGGTQGT